MKVKRESGLGFPLMFSKVVSRNKEWLIMNAGDSIGNIDFSDAEKYKFVLWKNKNAKLCESLLLEDEEFIGYLYYVQSKVINLILDTRTLNSKNISQAIETVESLLFAHKHLNMIKDKLLKKGKDKEAKALFLYSVGLMNTELKWGKSKIANYAIKQHQKQGANYVIPDLVLDKTWDKIRPCIVPKLCLWHIAFMVYPCDTLSATRKRKEIMTDLYDSIVVSDCLVANTLPPKTPKMIDDGQTIDRWEITLKDFKAAIESNCLKTYLKPYAKVWESFSSKDRSRRGFGRLENPEPFLQERLEMTGSAIDAKEFLKIKSKKEHGGTDKSQAFKDAMKAVEPLEGYRIIDSLDEYEQSEREPVKLSKPIKNTEKKELTKEQKEKLERCIDHAYSIVENWKESHKNEKKSILAIFRRVIKKEGSLTWLYENVPQEVKDDLYNILINKE